MTDDRFRLTALDARRWDFGSALRGYDRVRVDTFREQVAEELERMARANQELETKVSNFLEQLRVFRERDKALNEALVSAQQLRGEIRAQAEREAQFVLREAQADAERLVATVRADLRHAEEELQQLWRARQAFLAQFRTLVERQATEIAAAEHVAPPLVAPASGGSRVVTSRDPAPQERLPALPHSAAVALADAALADAALADAALADAALSDAALADAALADTALADTALADTALADTALAGTALADTALADTALADARDEGLGARLAIDATTPIDEPADVTRERTRSAMPTPSWLDALDEDDQTTR